MSGESRNSEWPTLATVIVLVVLFLGEPDIFDAMKKIALDYAGLEITEVEK